MSVGNRSYQMNSVPKPVVSSRLSVPIPPSSPRSDSESYSPTLSEEEDFQSYFDFEISQQSQIDDAGISKIAQQQTASPNYIKGDASPSIRSSLSPSSSITLGRDLSVNKSTLLERRLHSMWPQFPGEIKDAPFVVLWELARVAFHCGVDIAHLTLQYREEWKNQDDFWAALKAFRPFRGHIIPAKSDPRAWRAGIDGTFKCDDHVVAFTATMHGTDSMADPSKSLGLELHPFKLEQSSRLLRQFGSDRFLEVRIPSVNSWQSKEKDTELIAARWLANGPHTFINRKWSAFYVPDGVIKSEVHDDPNARKPKVIYYSRVLFFAESGKGLLEGKPSRSRPSQNPHEFSRISCSRYEMLDWLLNLKENGAESYLKLFHRVSLGLTKAIPAIVLKEDQIYHRSEDLRSDTLGKDGEVMNDGAGRISPSLMRKVRDTLGLQSIPSTIQGRLGSAKGMWLVDTTDQSNQDWIETYPAQRKWKCDMSKEAHRTLEVKAYSKELAPASLNIQFLPILEDRAPDRKGMREILVENMVIESEKELEELKLALQHPELFRKWAREGVQPVSQRLMTRSVPFLGSLPENKDDILTFLVDGGFDPMQLDFLQKIIFDKQRKRGNAMQEELKIRVSKSTYAYMLVDFWGVLEPNEVHLCFSSNFNDGTDELSDLDGRDILVARAPAHLPSDIQKVRAVFKPELRHLRDVIIFSAKGDIPLASMLSGGDYDGDRAWVCWEPGFVENFKNHPLPPKPDFSSYLMKDKLTLNHLRIQYGNEKYIDAMIEKAFCFKLRQSYLGLCTIYKEKFCYHRSSVSDKASIKLSWLLSDLADQAKQGIAFGEVEWDSFRKEVLRINYNPPIPAYKTSGASLRPGARHIIDYLMYEANKTVDKGLTDLNQFFKSSGSSPMDKDVTGYWDHFVETFSDPSAYGRPRCSWFLALNKGLEEDVNDCLKEWRDLVSQGIHDYEENVKQCYSRWRSIKPRLGRQDLTAVAAAARMFLLEDKMVTPDLSRWELLKASFTFSKKGQAERRFVWQMAGKQLQAIKALAARPYTGSGGEMDPLGHQLTTAPVLVVPNMYAALKPDNTYIKRLLALDLDWEDDFGYDGERRKQGLGGLTWGSSQDEY